MRGGFQIVGDIWFCCLNSDIRPLVGTSELGRKFPCQYRFGSEAPTNGRMTAIFDPDRTSRNFFRSEFSESIRAVRGH
ncbi:MAG: hypothetical protein CMH54_02170 [Myxococcales bacterium]|nr:hypothetical protein [Myxococcales bacterium]